MKKFYGIMMAMLVAGVVVAWGSPRVMAEEQKKAPDKEATTAVDATATAGTDAKAAEPTAPVDDQAKAKEDKAVKQEKK